MSTTQPAPIPTTVELQKSSKALLLIYGEERYQLPLEYLRVYSPSAEVKGHGPGQEVLQQGKQHVGITGIQAVGNYAIQPTFSDGHDTGIYSWDYLWELCQNQEAYWQDYLDRLAAAGGHRDPDVQVVRIGN